MSNSIKVGDKAPEFSLRAQNGCLVSLNDFRGSKNVVLYFYPKDFTAGCTAETKAFGENYQKIVELGAEVLGVSSDTAESHGRFASDCRASFMLLSDSDGAVRKAYGADSSIGLIPGRVSFVIDKQGIVRHVFSSQLRPKRHVPEAIEALKRLPR